MDLRLKLIRVSLNSNKTHCFDISLLGFVKASAYHSTPAVGSPLTVPYTIEKLV